MALSDYIYDKSVLRTDRLALGFLRPDDIPALLEWTPHKPMYKYRGKSAGKASALVLEKCEVLREGLICHNRLQASILPRMKV